ncbi:F-box domain-containing protein [Mycena sanguinolenta]|uniref:F-box domain-containing protein n=1 Tax=Mycena sanguinolenta TaxID=230812 RepID=A0A8H6Y8F8_9AGAR|nr:F-box domain-containing protein [Mycena sanguinolenta]
MTRRRKRIPVASPSDPACLAEKPLPCYISSIPPEILSQIMLIYARDLTIWDETRYWQPAGPIIPIRLTQICSSWRMLALDTRELWSSVTLMLNQRLRQNTSAITKFAHYWLAKGQRHKLALKIDIVEDCINLESVEDRIDLEPIGQLLTAWASDWRTLTIVNCPNSMAEYVIGKMAQSTYPSLEEFELHASSIVWHTRFEALAASPRLRTITFRTRSTPYSHHDLTLLFLPWSQLESICISVPVSGHQCLDVLKNCPGLMTLELFVNSDVPASEFRPPVVLSKLTRLRLTTCTIWGDSSDIESFLGVLHLPMLVDFDLYLGPGLDSWNPFISPFWQRHAAQLCSLKLFYLSFLDDCDLRPLFLTVPNLKSLKLSPFEIPLRAADFDALRVEQLLPALTHLDVAVEYEREIDSVRSAIALLEARSTAMAGVARIERVRLADWTNWDSVAMAMELQRLRALKTQGMDVQWMVRGHDLLASRETSIRSPSIRSASSHPPPSSEHYSDSDTNPAPLPITSPMKPKRNPFRRLWQRIKDIRVRAV